VRVTLQKGFGAVLKVAEYMLRNMLWNMLS
jgi:hypothetical protein